MRMMSIVAMLLPCAFAAMAGCGSVATGVAGPFAATLDDPATLRADPDPIRDPGGDFTFFVQAVVADLKGNETVTAVAFREDTALAGAHDVFTAPRDGTVGIVFGFATPEGQTWLPGRYRVDVSRAGDVIGSISFSTVP